MKKPILTILLFLFSLNLYAAKVEGVVGAKNEKVAFAKLYIPKLKKGSFSDQNGYYFFESIPTGKHEMIISAIGFENDTIYFEIKNEAFFTLNIELKIILKEIEEVTITATLKETSLSNSPIAITVISPKLFEKNPTPSIFESLNMVNGVRPQLQCNVCSTGDIHINGMEGPYTMVMIDGMPIVSALGTVYGLMGIPNSIIERVEIQKGPSSTLYGSEAVGGLINVITKKAENAPRFTFNAIGTSYQDYTLDLSTKFKLGKKITAILGGNSFLFNKKWDINKDNFTDVTLQNRIALFSKINFKHKGNNSSIIAFRYLYEDRWGGEMNWNSNYRGGDSIYGESIYTNRFEVIGNSPLSLFKSKVQLQYSYIHHKQNSAYGNTIFHANQDIGFLQFIKNIELNRNDIVIGLASRYTYYDDNTVITEIEDSLQTINHPTISFIPGIFLQDELKLNENNTLLFGMRYDYNSIHGSILSPRINWKSTLFKKHIFRLGVGNGYRVVNLFSEDHAAFNGARKVVILDDLKPEKSWNANLNYNSTFNLKRIQFGIDFNVFYNYFSNKIVADYFTDNEKVIFDNLKGYGICRGFGANFHFNFNFPLKLNVGTTFSDVYIMDKLANGGSTKNVQVQTPKLTSNFVLTYLFCKINTSIDISGNVYSPMLLPVLENDYRPSYSPWFTLINLQITKIIANNWHIYGGVKNLLNFVPKEDPILRPNDPFDKNINDPISNPNAYTFDPGYNYAPYQKARIFLGLRLILK
jgi:outer membrane receptor for ferrienterochelin and colicins